VIASWVLSTNLRPVLTSLAWTVGYEFGPDDWTAISHGIEGTDDQAGLWYDYEFVGQHRAEFALARDAESDVVHLRVKVPASLEPHVETAVAIFSYFRASAP
jgi:hypothetical protein